MTPDPLSPVGLAVRWSLFAGMLVAVGAAAFRFAVLARLGRPGGQDPLADALARRAAGLGIAGAALALAAALARLPLQFTGIRDPAAAAAPQLWALVGATTWGRAWIFQVLAAAIAAGAFRAARGGSRASWMLGAVAALVLAASPAFAGHAIGSERLPAVAIAADALHVVAAGCWIGAMLALAGCLALPAGGGRAELAAVLVAAFSPLALGAAATVTVSGLLSSWLHVGAWEQLTASRYGRTLLVKGGTVLAVVGAGAFNWRRAGPRLGTDGDVSRMQRSVRAELVLAALVLAATAVLVVTPPPGEE